MEIRERREMELSDALEKANQILDEERSSPTVTYRYASRSGSPELLVALDGLAGPINLSILRQERPRQVLEDPGKFKFTSVNYTLICQLLSQLPEGDRESFIAAVLVRMWEAPGCRKEDSSTHAAWNYLVSEFPLVAEFAIRNGGKSHLFRLLHEATLIPGHALLLRQLEEIIALNYNLFSDKEYEQLSMAALAFGRRAAVEEQSSRSTRTFSRRWPGIGELNVRVLFSEIHNSAEAVAEQCRKSRYLYLKGQLLEGLNQEINQDKIEVESYLVRFGFSKPLIDSLNEADRLYREQTSQFELKSSMGHLRSFMENLHSEAFPAISAQGITAPSPGWGPGLTFLRKSQVLSDHEEKFAAGLYGLISDEAIHPLIAEKEYARLARNMVIEYALLFLRKVEKLGLKKTALAAV